MVGLLPNVCGRRGHARSLQYSRRHDLIAQCRRHGIGIHDHGTQSMERSRQTEREPARLPQNVEVIFDANSRQIHGVIHRVDDIHDGSKVGDCLHDCRHKASAAR